MKDSDRKLLQIRAAMAAWEDSAYVEKFARKEASDFFTTERHFLSRMREDIASVLDIGCSSGRFLELMRSMNIKAPYTGIDLSECAIGSARALYPQAAFYAGDALTLQLDGRFDLVNATGVFQHEPRFDELLDRMLAWSNRYVLFDVKFANVDCHLIDIETSYSSIRGKKIFFVVLHPDPFFASLARRDGVASVSVFGYRTPKNDITTLPENVTALFSAGVLLKKGTGPVSWEIELPDDLECGR